MFVSLGFMLHLLNDMNVPAHMRNDAHAPDDFEYWMRGGEDGTEDGGFRIYGNSLSPKNNGEILRKVLLTTPTKYSTFEDFYKEEGIATGKHFFSEDTILKKGYELEDTLNIPTYNGYISSQYGKLAIRNVVSLSDGVIRLHMKKGDDKSVLIENGMYLIPRAVANAEGFINYFFRGRLKASLDSENNKLIIENISDETLVAESRVCTFKKGMTVHIYYTTHYGYRKKLFDKGITLNKDVEIGQKYYIDNINEVLKEKDVDIYDDIIILLEGELGKEDSVVVGKVRPSINTTISLAGEIPLDEYMVGDTVRIYASGENGQETTISWEIKNNTTGKIDIVNDFVASYNLIEEGSYTINLYITEFDGITQKASSTDLKVLSELTKVINLNTTIINKNKIKISWDSVANVDGYNVYTSSNMLTDENLFDDERVESATDRKDFKVIDNNTSIILDVELGKEYGVIVQSYRKTRTSFVFSDLLVFQTNLITLAIPKNLTATATTDAITLNWDEVLNVSAYKICMAEEKIDSAKGCTEHDGGKIIGSVGTTNTITDDLVVGTTYYFRARGFKDGYGIAWSDEVNATAVIAGFDENAFSNPELNTEHNVKNVGLDTVDGTLKLSLDGSNVDSTFPFIWIANSGEGTISKLNTVTGEELGRYRTGSGNFNPSRTTVDQDGNVWVGNRSNNTITKVGLKEWDQCIDRNDNGIIDTSTGATDVKSWTGSVGEGIINVEDECILKHIVLEKDGLSANAVRLVAIDPDNNVFVGGSQSNPIFKVNGTTGEIINAVSTLQNHYGGVVDKDGNLWSMASNHNGTVQKISNNMDLQENINIGHNGYGITIDKYGKVWTTEWSSRFSAFHPSDPVGTLKVFNQTGHSSAQGLASNDNGDIFIAGADSSNVGHYRQLFDENREFTGVEFVKNYTVQSGVTGVAIDGTGKVWSSNRYSNSVSRIDPVTEIIEHFPVGSTPYNYSDMTGSIVRTVTKRQGTWEATFNGEEIDYPWNKVSWKLKEALPEGTTVTVFAKVDNSEIGLNAKDYIEVTNEEVLSSLTGQYLKLKVELSSDNLTSTPEVIEIQLY